MGFRKHDDSCKPRFPAYLLRMARDRLRTFAWITIGVGVAMTLALLLLESLLGPDLTPQAIHASPAKLLFTTANIALSLGVVWLTRRERLGDQQVCDLGLVYLVLFCFGLALSRHITDTPIGYLPPSISPVGIIIVLFPVLVPTPTHKTVIVGVAAATTELVALAVWAHAGHSWPPSNVVFALVFGSYMCALLAVFPARVIHKLGSQVSDAVELGSYRLVDRLGAGGMGEVWVAEHQLLARPAAVKLIRADVVGSTGASRDSALARFEREAQATAALASPHTVDLYDFGIAESGELYYVMELLDGLDLEDLVDRFGPQSAGRTIHLLAQACESLADAHAAGLVHRDIKPANIFACRYGVRRDFVKVLDFGLVKRGGDGDAKLTMEGMATGTPAFMSPEQAMGERDTDHRVDLYALGCVGYWLLTGSLVFEATSPMATVLKHVKDPPVAPSLRTDIEVPEALDAVILQCLAKDRAARPQSAEVLAEALATIDVPPWTHRDAARWWDMHMPTPRAGETTDATTRRLIPV